MKKNIIYIINLFFVIIIIFSGCTANEYWYFSCLKLSDNNGIGNCTIAIIDTGINDQYLSEHRENITNTYNVLNNSNDVSDQHGHGTEMVSILLGDEESNLVGINPNASIIIVKAIGESGKTDNSNIAKAIDFLLNQDELPDIINLSLGSLNNDPSLEKMISLALEKGIIIVASVGDYSQKDILYPSAYVGVISVQAIDVNGNLDYMSNTSAKTTLSFPGVGINVLHFENQEREIKQIQGSSAATILASGYFSLFLANCQNKGIDITNQEFYQYLTSCINDNKVLNYKEFIDINNFMELYDE